MTFAHADDTAAADLETEPLQHFDIVDTLIKGVGGANVVIIGTAAV